MNNKNPYIDALCNIVKKIDIQIPQTYTKSISMYCAGGIAMSYWVGPSRQTSDIDAIFEPRIFIGDIHLDTDNLLSNIDCNFNDTLSALQEDYQNRAVFLTSIGRFSIYILSPEDLTIMKISRWNLRDRNDVLLLIQNRLLHEDILHELYNDARIIYIGDTSTLDQTFNDVIYMLRSFNNNVEYILPYMK